MCSNYVPLGVDWRTASGFLVDSRDTITSAGRFFRAGGNPYDPNSFLAAFPGAQEFDPYAPSWFLIAAPLSHLSVPAGGAVFMAVMLGMQAWIAMALAHILDARRAHAVAPIIFFYEQIWGATRLRGASILVIFGITVFLWGLRQADMADRLPRSAGSHFIWLGALGLAIALIKPQYGLLIGAFAIFLRVGRAAVWRGVLIACVLSVLPFIKCLRAAGGMSGFVSSVRSDVTYASSGSAATATDSANSYRIDLVGIIGRLTLHEVGTVPSLLCWTVVLMCCLVALRRSPTLATLATTGVSSMLLLPVHSDYDLASMLIPAAVACAILVHRRTPADWARAGMCVMICINPHFAFVHAGMTLAGAEAIDAILLLGVVVLGAACPITPSRMGRRAELADCAWGHG